MTHPGAGPAATVATAMAMVAVLAGCAADDPRNVVRTTSAPARLPADSPITIQPTEKDGFVTCSHRGHPDNRIGYRFHEHTPIVHGSVPGNLPAAGIDPQATARLEQVFAGRPQVLTHTVQVDQPEWTPQRWTFYMVPVDDGIDLLLVVETAEQGLNEYYGIQQCFRMSGRTNEAWRHVIARTPAFSEYDLWSIQADKPDKTSLTHVLRGGAWQPLPPTAESVGSRTPLGIRIDTARSGGKLESMPTVGPYTARMLEPADCGLIARRSVNGEWVCGIYWERTSHVTDHHPADCLHTIINIGGLAPHARRALRGKIYWFQGSLADLLEHWRRDWPEAMDDR